jgi:RluA family pseudouridine synthase
MARTQIDILFDDDDLLVINKPAGVLTVPGRDGGRSVREAIAAIEGQEQDLRIVHRLDRHTSGVLVLTRTVEAQRSLSQQFESRTVEKQYLAIVQGNPPDDSGMIHAALGPDPRVTGKMRVSESKGKPAQTRWRVQERFGFATLMRCWPLTGRQHQIRVHLQLINHPLLVDPLYGGAEAFFLSSVKPDYKPSHNRPERPLLDRLSLHAERITFKHPRTGQNLQIDAALPKDFRATLNQFRKLVT